MRYLPFFLLLASAIAIGGCKVYDPALLDSGGGTEECVGRVPPDRPTVPDGSGTEELYFALRNVVLNQSGNRWRDIGFNLDGLCTTSTTPDVECEPAMGSGLRVDGNDGIDNTFGSDFFELVRIVRGDLEISARAEQEAGNTPILRIRLWNGEDNDPHVQAMISQAVFTVQQAGDGSIPAFTVMNFEPYIDGTRAPPPTWDGSDYAFLRADSFVAGDLDRPLIVDDNAYIRDRTLYARLPDRVDIFFPAEDLGVLVRITDAVAAATISADLQSIENVVVGGRWSINDLLLTAENVGICEGSDNYILLLDQLQRISDVRSNPDTGGPGVVCDALSVGVGFSGTRVRFGGLTDDRPLPNDCGMMGADAGPMDADAGVGSDAGP